MNIIIYKQSINNNMYIFSYFIYYKKIEKVLLLKNLNNIKF